MGAPLTPPPSPPPHVFVPASLALLSSATREDSWLKKATHGGHPHTRLTVGRGLQEHPATVQTIGFKYPTLGYRKIQDLEQVMGFFPTRRVILRLGSARDDSIV